MASHLRERHRGPKSPVNQELKGKARAAPKTFTNPWWPRGERGIGEKAQGS
jgi:hypothetical protein